MTHINSNRCSRFIRTVCVGVVLVISGCTQRIGDLTLVSTKNIDLSNAHMDVREGRRVKGEDCAYAILGLIPTGLPNLEEAVDDALENGHGNVMVDQVTYHHGAYFILAASDCIQVEGTVLNVAGGRAAR